MTGKTPISAKLSPSSLPIALLALSLTFGASAVRADSEAPAPSWREMLVDPIMDAVKAVEDRLSGLEATVASMAGSFTTRQIITQQLCVSDENGAQTCISKTQLDALLKTMAQAAAVEPRVTVTEAKPAVLVEPAVVDLFPEPAVAVPEGSRAAAVEPSDTFTEAKVVTPIELPAAVTEGALVNPAVIEPAALKETTTIATAPAPAAVPGEAAIPEENAPKDQKSARTVATTSDAALIRVGPVAPAEPAVVEPFPEPALAVTEGNGAAVVERTDTVTEAKAATAIEPPAAVTEAKAAALVKPALEPAALEETTTIATAPAPVTVPGEAAIPEENAPKDQKSARTVATTSDAALVRVEISIPTSVASEE